MSSILLGHSSEDGQPIRIPKSALDTHLHLIGGTGKGKTTALHTILQPLMLDPFDNSSFIIIDRLGGFAQELLLWMSSEFCTDRVRERLVYIEPSREDVVLPLNPLLYDSDAHGYFKVSRATDIVLRAWESVNIEAMPRLARWTFNSFWAAAQLGLTIADCVHFLMPGSGYHEDLLRCLPDRLQFEWEEIIGSRSSETIRILESSRNRLKPFFESDILRRMFGASENRFDAGRFMQEGKIVVVNLQPGNRLSEQLADTIGALILNEVLTTARSFPRGVRYPTHLVLDEFQRFIGPDIEAALPEVRQLGIKLLLSHQSMSQLVRGDYDLTSMIFQAQSRLIFGVQGPDADLLAEELASITYDPKRLKDELYTRRQLVTGHRVVELSSRSTAESFSEQWKKDFGTNWSAGQGTSYRTNNIHELTRTGNRNSGASARQGEGGGTGSSSTVGSHETLVPVHDEFLELSTRSYFTFDEQKHLWAQGVRNLETGTGLLRVVNDPKLYETLVKRSAPGHLKWPMQILAQEYPAALEQVDRLIEKNFQQDLFVAPQDIDRQTEERLQQVLHPSITVQLPKTEDANDAEKSPFR